MINKISTPTFKGVRKLDSIELEIPSDKEFQDANKFGKINYVIKNFDITNDKVKEYKKIYKHAPDTYIFSNSVIKEKDGKKVEIANIFLADEAEGETLTKIHDSSLSILKINARKKSDKDFITNFYEESRTKLYKLTEIIANIYYKTHPED